MSTSLDTFDPFTQDPPVDPDHPAVTADVHFFSAGSRLNGVLHVANGPGPHPAVIFFHGFPGNERNFDLAQLCRRAGFNTLVFHYRGSWHSQGAFSFANAIADADAALDFVLSPEAIKRHRIDPGRISVIGHSLGGFIALRLAANRAEVRAAIGLAFVNLGAMAQGNFPTPELRLEWSAGFDGETAPLTGTSGTALIDEIWAHRAEWDLLADAAALARKQVALAHARRDHLAGIAAMHSTLVSAIRAEGGDVTDLCYNADHSFASHRVEVARDVLAFLRLHG